MKPLEALMHPYFDELRNPKCRINGKPLDNLFNFTEGTIKSFKTSIYARCMIENYLLFLF